MQLFHQISHDLGRALWSNSVKHVFTGLGKKRAPGLVNFVHAVAYHLCLALPLAITQPGARLKAELCISYVTEGAPKGFEFPRLAWKLPLSPWLILRISSHFESQTVNNQ